MFCTIWFVGDVLVGCGSVVCVLGSVRVKGCGWSFSVDVSNVVDSLDSFDISVGSGILVSGMVEDWIGSEVCGTADDNNVSVGSGILVSGMVEDWIGSEVSEKLVSSEDVTN